MEYFENTTRITEEGFAAILQLKRRQKTILYRIVSTVLAIPLTERLCYYGILFCSRNGAQISWSASDWIFALLFLLAIWFWFLPKNQVSALLQKTKNQIDLQAVNQYVFLPEEIHMMTTSSSQKYCLNYENLTWVRSSRRWIVLYFSRQDFTMLVDRQGFTKGTASACLAFLKNKMDGINASRQ